MDLLKKIDTDLNSALKSGEASKVSVLRMLKSAIHNQQIAAGKDLADDEVLKIIQKEAKQHQESIDSFKSAGRDDMAAKETEELKHLEQYLPKSLDAAALEGLVAEGIKESGATSASDIGKVMAYLNQKAPGQIDGAQAAALVKEKLL